jgi:hypothetical protein
MEDAEPKPRRGDTVLSPGGPILIESVNVPEGVAHLWNGRVCPLKDLEPSGQLSSAVDLVVPNAEGLTVLAKPVQS